MVDIFAKFTQVVLIDSKTINDVIAGMKQYLKVMRHPPKSMYMDFEGAFVSKEMKEYFESVEMTVNAWLAECDTGTDCEWSDVSYDTYSDFDYPATTP
jgi:hypothetical protein